MTRSYKARHQLLFMLKKLVVALRESVQYNVGEADMVRTTVTVILVFVIPILAKVFVLAR